MIRMVIVGIWSCTVALSCAYAGARWSAPSHSPSDQRDPSKIKVSHVKVKPISIPVTQDNRVAGYVIAQFSYTAAADQLKSLEVKPDVFFYDAVFNEIYANRNIDINTLNRESWKRLLSSVKAAVNSRLGSPILRDLMIEEFGYVPYEHARGAAKAQMKPSPAASNASRDSR